MTRRRLARSLVCLGMAWACGLGFGAGKGQKPSPDPSPSPALTTKPESLSARLEREFVLASPESLRSVISAALKKPVEGSEYGRALLYAAVKLRARLYPDAERLEPQLDPPALNPLVRVSDEVASGRFPDAELRRSDVSCLLVALSILCGEAGAPYRDAAMIELARLESAGPPSCLYPFIRALDKERQGDWAAALGLYGQVRQMAPDAYTADIGYARCLVKLRRGEEAMEGLALLRQSYPKSVSVARIYASELYARGRRLEAAPLIQEVLSVEPANEAFLLMRVQILMDDGKYMQAYPLLTAYGKRNPNDPSYIKLKASYAWKEQSDKGGALAILRGGLSLYPENVELSGYMSEILLDGTAPNSEDRQKARSLIESALVLDPGNTRLRRLAVREALGSMEYDRAWRALGDLLDYEADYKEYALMVEVAQKAKKPSQALSWSKAWYARSAEDEQAIAALARAYLDSGDLVSAQGLITKSLEAKPSARLRSKLYYLRSRMAKGGEASLAELRSSLMEDPRNLDALLSMFDLYFGQKDYKRAQYYLRQAQTAAPGDGEVAQRERSLGGLANQ